VTPLWNEIRYTYSTWRGSDGWTKNVEGGYEEEGQTAAAGLM